jgi:hypothetical protein
MAVSGMVLPSAFMAAAHAMPGWLWLWAPGLWIAGTIAFLLRDGGRFFDSRNGDAPLEALLLLFAAPPVAAMCVVRWLG